MPVLYDHGGIIAKNTKFHLFLLDFLTRKVRDVGSYSFNTIRSAISLVSNKVIGNHHLIKRFGKGISVIKPQKPRYEYVWDPASVITQLTKIFPYESLLLNVITRKLVLLALGSGQRVQTLAAIRVSYILIANNKLIIKIPDRIKTSAPGSLYLFFHVFLIGQNFVLLRS